MKKREREREEEEVEGKRGEKGDTGGKEEEGGTGEGKGREAKLLEERVEGRTQGREAGEDPLWRRVAAEKPLLVECKEDRRLLSQHS